MAEPTNISRHARLFAAHSWTVKFDGPGWFRTQQGQARRLGTQLAKAVETCAVVLDDEEKATLQAAARLLSKLGNDFELATREAKAETARLEREHQARVERDRLKIEADHLAVLDAAGLTCFIDDIQRFAESSDEELVRILGRHAPKSMGCGLNYELGELCKRLRAGEPLNDMTKAKRLVALWLEKNIEELSFSFPGIKLESWRAWRAHRARMRSLVESNAFDPSVE